MKKIITAATLFLISASAHAQSALDDPDTQRVLNDIHEEQVYNERRLESAGAFNPPSGAYYS